ncbi:putative inorganic phosphate cotransporter [Euwallacea similis]|uniref:putative inorganic phosphate cotransporter n=1 Tax=Euwallacea similis TaxID=1736056 RepID=UPI0034502BF5
MSSLKKVSVIQNRRLEDESKKVNQVTLDSIKDAKKREIYIRGYDKDDKGPKIGKRHIQAFLICMGITIAFAMRNSFSIAIVAMTDKNASPNPNVHTYNWTNKSVILSSFFWGYVCLQVLAGYLANTYGPKNFLIPTFAINSVAFMVIPFAADQWDYTGVIICRVIQGLTQGFVFPSAHTILGKWAPVEERATIGTIVYTGVNIGPILSSLIAGYISSSWIGWPASFYIIGSLGLAWCFLYLFLGFNAPAVHPTITKEERDYIHSSLKESASDEVIPVPWKSILTSLPVFAILVCSMGGAWGYSMMMTEIPIYLAKVMKFEIATNGLASAIPYMASLVAGFIYAPLSDYLIRRGYLSTLNSRRLFQLIGSYGQLICLLLLTYVAKTKTTSVLFLSIGNGLYIAILAGQSINHVDISPRFCGIIQGICNGSSQILSIFAPLLVNFVVQKEEEADQWKIVFLVTTVIYFVCATFFAIFASVTRQPWDGPTTEEPEKIERMKKQSLVSLSGY